ncbi:MAG TPA: site-2 protease family protein, partial [Actinoplanes sp.]|nr:site-2 protease family protein [Actinoplanes sp.]
MLYGLGVVGFALAILISVSLHEAGHMITAKRFGMKVTKYFVGFGPTLFSWRRGETEYGLKAIPLGGFCKIVGMTPQDDDVEPGDEPRVMWKYPVWKRTIVMSAGSITHFALAIVALWFAAAFVGLPNPDLPVTTAEERAQPAVLTVSDCVVVDLAATTAATCTPADVPGPAKVAGLQTGDVVTAVNGAPVANWGELVDIIRGLPTTATTFAYTRDGQSGTATVTPVRAKRTPLGDAKAATAEVSVIGAGRHEPRPFWKTYGAVGAFGATADHGKQLLIGTFEAFKKIPAKVPALWRSITGSERDPETPISVVGASRLGGEAIEAGVPQLFMIIFISLNVFIGIFNLLPLLPLDGGHIAIIWFEKARSWLFARLKRPDPGRVDYYKLMPLTYAVILVGGVFTLLTVTADIVNP